MRRIPSWAAALAALGVFTACGGEPAAAPARGVRGAAPAASRTASAPANGFRGDVAWRSLDEGLSEAKQLGLPVMVVVHTDWCPKCKGLKQSFADPELVSLSQQFVMINVDQDASPVAEDYAIDGSYIPRVVFLDSKGLPLDDVVNARSPRYRYFYADAASLLPSMRRVLETAPERS